METSDQYPQSLTLLDDDSDAAFTELYRYAWSRFSQAPPRPMAVLPRQEREDLIQEIVYHCIKNDFRVLRAYRSVGRPFSHWLYMVAYNKSLDYWRKNRREEYRETEPERLRTWLEHERWEPGN